MRRLIAILAVGVFLSVAGIAAADTTPATTTTPTTTAPTKPGHWFAGAVTGVGSNSLTVGVLWTGPNDGSLNGQSVTVAVDRQHPDQQGPPGADRAGRGPGRRPGCGPGRRHVALGPHGTPDPRLLQLPLDRRHDRVGGDEQLHGERRADGPVRHRARQHHGDAADELAHRVPARPPRAAGSASPT